MSIDNLERRQSIEIYRNMMRIRLFEEKASDLYRAATIPGFMHTYIGEEAVAVGVCTNLRKDDYIVSTHRGHGHCIAKGARLDSMMAELMGKKDGLCGGKAGSMHLMDLSIGIVGCNGIVGAGIPIATGAGLSARIRGTDQVTVCFFGDGASNQGTFHEGINLAAVWNLPVIFVCESNLYASYAHIRDSTPIENIADRASAYGIPGSTVDGNEVIAVYEAGRTAVRRAREGNGPTLIECKTYRWRGHHEGDLGTEYRSQEEVQVWKDRCPIKRFRETLIESNQFTDEELRRVEEDAVKEIDEAIKFAQRSPFPAPEEGSKHVYSTPS